MYLVDLTQVSLTQKANEYRVEEEHLDSQIIQDQDFIKELYLKINKLENEKKKIELQNVHNIY